MPKSQTNELKLTRVYDAPAAAVWAAWTNPAQIAQWWGPRGFTLTTHSKDLRPGGQWIYTMHGPDGTDYPNIATYYEVVDNARLVYDHGATPDTPPMFRVTVTFEERDGRTTMNLTMALATVEAAQETAQFIRKANGNSTWDRLSEHLTQRATGKEKFVINRSFDAPLERVFDAWSNLEQFSRWLPPTGQTMEMLEGDVRPGGKTFWRMQGNGISFHGATHYLEITRPNRLVYVQRFADEHGGCARHPFAPTWPEAMLTTVELSPEGPDATRVTVTWEPTATTTQEERDTFIQARTSMTMGWTGSFDKLEALLA